MKKITVTLCATLSLLTPFLGATTTVIGPGQTETNTVTVANAGDELIIEEGGAVTTTNEDAVSMNADNQKTTNDGAISTTGASARGILNNGGSNAVITNSGSISTTGSGASGILTIVGDNVVITNSGSISTTESNAYGIVNDSGAFAVITNSGSISTTNLTAHGIVNDGDNVVITNSGSISTTESNAYGIFINFNSDNAHVINSGTIYSALSNALDFQGSTPTLTLLRGSNIQGPVKVSNSAASLALNVEKGLNLALTLTGNNFGTLGISLPFVQVGSTIATVDPTGLAMQADVAADLSDTILDGIYRHRLSCCTPCDCGVWAQAIGSYRKRSEGHDIVGFDNWQGGFLVGYERLICEGRASLFGGATFGKAEVDETTARADINSYVGGLSYETCFCNSFLGLAIVAGYVDWDNERFIMNNQVAGGIDKAHADIDGFFITPEATLAHQFASLWCHPSLSFTLRYAGLFLGDYNEKGSQTNFSAKDRDIGLITTRLEAAVPYSRECGICCWSLEPYIGGFGRYQVNGNRIKGELLAQPLNFDQGGAKNLAALLIGFRGIQSYGCLNLSLNVEASFDTGCSSRILGEGGLGWNF
ncbi:MAG: hypothetical protein K940chlam2_01746 [Chlamydiae bacterium]|nr:hypothetical protein [Chlamydiota bacterium]